MLNEISILEQTTSWLEIIAMLTGVLGVYLTIKENIWCFPVGIINVTLYAILFLSPGIRLYADALLQCIYILLLFYGWMKWADRNKSASTPLKMNSQSILIILFITFFATIILGRFFSTYTDASYPWLDSALTCASLSAQWMIAKKYIENWIVWIIVDFIYLPLYYTKSLPFTAALYFLFLILAVIGYLEWRKKVVHE